jgi:hypothetical protein
MKLGIQTIEVMVLQKRLHIMRTESGYRTTAGFFEYGDEPSGFMKARKFLSR